MGDQLFAQEKTERGLPRSVINEATGASYQKILCIESVSVVVAFIIMWKDLCAVFGRQKLLFP